MRLLTYIQTHHQISRRTFVTFVKEGYVSINGKKIESYTQEVQEGDRLEIQAPNFNLKAVIATGQKISKIILFNKPKGYVASKSDPHNMTIYDILPPEFKNYYYI